jgi:hypothetical protein
MRNITANYISHGYANMNGIAMTPLYLQYLGAKTYGLVGFFAVLQT